MAAALIWYKQRQDTRASTAAARRAVAPGKVGARGAGKGAVVFDVETTNLIEDDVPVQEMEVSVACATWVPEGATPAAAREGAESRTFWHDTVARAPNGGAADGIEVLLTWFDGASVIVGYNARAFDMQVMKRYYGGDEDRWQAHMRKVRDTMEAAQRATGRRQKLSTVLRENAHAGKAGTGCDAPRWWKEGKLAQLEGYCERDVEALVDLVMQPEIRLPGRAVTREASVLDVVVVETQSARRKETGTEAGTAAEGSNDARAACVMEVDEGAGQARTRARDDGADEENDRQHDRRNTTAMPNKRQKTQQTVGSDDETAAATEEGGEGEVGERAGDASGDEEQHTEEQQHAEADQHENNLPSTVKAAVNRKRKLQTYDEVQRRKPRRTTRGAYVERGHGRGGRKRDAIVMGPAALENVVRGAYEWRDDGLRMTTGARKRFWEELNDAAAATQAEGVEAEAAGDERAPRVRRRDADARGDA